MGSINKAFTALAFIAFVLVCIPLPWHLEAHNSGTCLYMVWTALACLTLFIDAVMWDGNAENWAPVWCDISTRILAAASIAIPAASVCINRRLWKIASVRTVITSARDKRREVLIDMAIGIFFPLICVALLYIVQGHRFDIYEDLGCRMFIHSTHLSFVIAFVPPLALGTISSIYAVLSIRAFLTRMTEFKDFLATNRSMKNGRYFRLMAIGALDIMFTMPFVIYSAYYAAVYGKVYPWVSWEDTHFWFSRVGIFPANIWRASPVNVTLLEIQRWIFIACAFSFFTFFGFADEAVKNYKKAYDLFTSRIGKSGGSINGGSALNSTLRNRKDLPTYNDKVVPVYVHREVVRKTDSLGTLSDSDLGSLPSTPHLLAESAIGSPSIFPPASPTTADNTLASVLPIPPMSARSESRYSQASAPRPSSESSSSSSGYGPTRPERPISVPMSVTTGSISFLEMATPHDSMLASIPHDRV